MKDWVKTALQYVLPQHLLSRLMGRFAVMKRPKWLIILFIKSFIRHYGVNMQEALLPNADDYDTFNAFFTRHLIPGIRPLDSQLEHIISPADGTISEIGHIKVDKLMQAKNYSYQLVELLGGKTELADLFLNGHFATIYLAPKDYHRVHMPVAGNLQQMLYVPGRLFSVNQRTANRVPSLFARNERAIAIFQTPVGKMAVVLVGAMIVASIATSWSGIIAPPQNFRVQEWTYQDIFLDKGAELGYFQLGSTVILLFQPNQIDWMHNLESGHTLRVGQTIAKYRS
jgi:phosphatidylserine decarboxylase